MTRETIEYVRDHLIELERMVRTTGHHPLATLLNFALLETEEILRIRRPREIEEALIRHNPAAILPFPTDDET